jgi:hypothetical protein
MFVQELPIKLVEGIARRVRVEAPGIGGTSRRRLSRLSRSRVRIADAFATASRPDLGRERRQPVQFSHLLGAEFAVFVVGRGHLGSDLAPSFLR